LLYARELGTGITRIPPILCNIQIRPCPCGSLCLDLVSCWLIWLHFVSRSAVYGGIALMGGTEFPDGKEMGRILARNVVGDTESVV
jgi:hypothetical protein